MMETHLDIRVVRNDREWKAAVAVRTEVFIEEQSCPPHEEWDGYDETSRHLVGWLDHVAVAVSRWRTVVHETRLVAKLERFAVRAPYRRRGFGRAMVVASIEDAKAAGFGECLIHAQAHLEAYYAGLGFRRFGEGFVEAGIAHVGMTLIDR